MIDKDEIQLLAANNGLHPHVIEKDYVLGWVLAGINTHEQLSKQWIFKGGTCLKKCYFKDYRFSEDLDFTQRQLGYLPTSAELLMAVQEVAEWVYNNSGIELPDNGINFEIIPNKRGSHTVQGKLSYRGVMQPNLRTSSLPRIKIDLTIDEPLLLDAALCDINHSYSDRPVDGFKIQAYTKIELFAEKIRALIQRPRPRDLYDVVHLYHNSKQDVEIKLMRDLLTQKCFVRNLDFPNIASIKQHPDLQFLQSEWHNQLQHQIYNLVSFAECFDHLEQIFTWLEDARIN